jgi:hypothetical protein
MIRIVASIFIASLGVAGVASAQAFPIAPLTQTEATAPLPVAGGCGAGWHRGPDGACRRTGGGKACRRGYELTPRGCRPVR